MRNAPPLQLRVTRFGAWRAGVLLLTTCACAAMLAWWATQPAPAPRWARAATALAVLAACMGAATLWRAKPLVLRWDGQQWWLAQGGGAEQTGELALAIDLGGWLLLRFLPAPGRRPRWIAVQRRGLEGQWHALRCALYGSRPALRTDPDERHP